MNTLSKIIHEIRKKKPSADVVSVLLLELPQTLAAMTEAQLHKANTAWQRCDSDVYDEKLAANRGGESHSEHSYLHDPLSIRMSTVWHIDNAIWEEYQRRKVTK